MRSVFEKYDGRNSQSAVVDYLQENVRKPLNSPESCLEKNDLALREELGLGKRARAMISWNSSDQISKR